MSPNIGCFGSILCHDATSDICGNCLQMSLCITEIEKNYSQLEESLEAKVKKVNSDKVKKEVEKLGSTSFEQEDLTKASTRRGLTKYELATIAKTDAKPRIKREIKALLRKNLTSAYIRNVLLAGKNPFHQEKPEFLKVACENMLTNQLKINKISLTRAYEASGQNRKTALAQTNNAVNLFRELGVVDKHLNINKG
jgi:hypothetical protein